MISDNILSGYFSYNALKKYIQMNNLYMDPMKSINMFIDLRSILGVIHDEDYRRTMVNRNNVDNLKICRNILTFISRLRQFFKDTYNCTVKFYLFLENSQSLYHQTFYRKYKERRQIKFEKLGKGIKQYTDNLIDHNFNIVDALFGIIPNATMIIVDDIEADFMPQYILREFIDLDETNLNIIRSDDKDLAQILFKYDSRVVQIRKKSIKLKEGNKYRERVTEILGRSNALKHIIKKDIQLLYDPAYYKWSVEWLLSIAGDAGDDIPGITGVAYKKAYDAFIELLKRINEHLPIAQEGVEYMNNYIWDFLNNPKEFISLTSDETVIYLLDYEKQNIHNYSKKKNKKLYNIFKLILDNSDIVSRNVYLTSFDKLIDYCNGTRAIRYKKYFDNINKSINNISSGNECTFYDFKEMLKEFNLTNLILTKDNESLYY